MTDGYPIDATNSLAALRELLPVSADVRPGHPAVWHARRRLLGVVVHLAEKLGASLTLADSNGRTPLYAATGFAGGGGHLKVVQLLAGSGGSVTQPDNDGCTPLLMAAQEGHLGWCNGWPATAGRSPSWTTTGAPRS